MLSYARMPGTARCDGDRVTEEGKKHLLRGVARSSEMKAQIPCTGHPELGVRSTQPYTSCCNNLHATMLPDQKSHHQKPREPAR